jgi:hypothetical protein
MAACPWEVVMIDRECPVGPAVVVVLPDEIDSLMRTLSVSGWSSPSFPVWPLSSRI